MNGIRDIPCGDGGSAIIEGYGGIILYFPTWIPYGDPGSDG